MFEEEMAEDYIHFQKMTMQNARQYLLMTLNLELESLGKNLKHFQLDTLITSVPPQNPICKEILDETELQISEVDLATEALLNEEQKIAYIEILDSVFKGKSKPFFIDGPGGTGKTYLYKALLAAVRSQRKIALATATSGVAASILPNGRIAHSRFKIPIGEGKLACNVTKQSGLAELFKATSLIIWDEATMAKKQTIEALDTMLQDITNNHNLFGGKVVVLGGDFRQVLPVIPKGTREDCVNASLIKSYIWQHLNKYKLKTNMRAQFDPSFSEFLLRVGNGIEKTYLSFDETEDKNQEGLYIDFLNSVTPTDILFAVLNVGERRKTTKTYVANLRVIDQSMKPVTISLWADYSDQDATEIAKLQGPFPIVLGTRLRLSPYYASGLATRFTTIFMLNPSLPEVAELQAWCTANAAAIKALPDNNNRQTAMTRALQPPKEVMTKIANLPTTVDTPQFPSIEGHIRVTNFNQQFYFIACPKCKRATDAYDDDDDEMWCNHCNQQVPPLPIFCIELGPSKQAVSSGLADLCPSWMLAVSESYPFWRHIAELLPVLALIMLAYMLHESISRSSCRRFLKNVIRGTIFSYLLIAAYWTSESKLLNLPPMRIDMQRHYIPKVIYMIGFGQLSSLALLQFLSEEKTSSWKETVAVKIVAVLSAWSSTIIILSGRQGPVVALASMAGGAFSSSHLMCAFDGLHYAAAFIGFEEFILVPQAILLSIDTFGFSHILPIFGLPFLAIQQVPSGQGEQQKRFFLMQLCQVYLMYGLITATTATFTMLCVAIQRRHLMVWGLFAPTFVFDVVGLMLTDFLIFLALLYYCVRVDDDGLRHQITDK
ncbi:hypothetical protein RHGRI_029599 [Rhododendron griersonianum]|uniref:ATP-dependent DNA helicase n=1 Tax=Rhododendron griersonianum TaxID=479676 RepID=A0AAV6IN93_9ERIC|nr:hypothetical protein RHGRI_029599 [Rhododendron griersonianum]